jgi:hypothetical protein
MRETAKVEKVFLRKKKNPSVVDDEKVVCPLHVYSPSK